ncbi:hypothetical protein WU83_17585, partial [Mycobacterium nebraskense]
LRGGGTGGADARSPGGRLHDVTDVATATTRHSITVGTRIGFIMPDTCAAGRLQRVARRPTCRQDPLATPEMCSSVMKRELHIAV